MSGARREIKLKPCPFCGGEAVFKTISNESDRHSVGFTFTVGCEDCGMRLPNQYDINLSLTEDGKINVLNDKLYEAVEKWNRGRSMHDERIRLIAKKYGYGPQSRQLIEEMAELTQALNKLWRKQTFGGNSQEIADAHANVEEEMADVVVMLRQVQYLLDITNKDLERIMDRKLERQMDRINQK